MNFPHDQDREWALVRRIRELRESDPQGAELKAVQAELVAAFEDDIRETGSEIRAKCASYGVFQKDHPGREGGILENHLRMWIIYRSVPRYDPSKNDSFAKYVFVGWRSMGSIQEYLKEFESPTRPVKDDEGKIIKDDKGKVVKEIVRLISLDTGGGDSEGGDLATDVEDDQGEAPRETMELLDTLDAVAREASLTPERMLELLKPLAIPQCEPDETDEHRRREAMLALLRDDLSSPDCSDEFQRRQWWNSLVGGSE